MNADVPDYGYAPGLSFVRFQGRYRAKARRWLVRKLIRKIQRGVTIWALPGEGKGVTVILIAIALLNGLDLNGRQAEKVKRIVYADGEEDAEEFGLRVIQTCAGLSRLLGREIPVPSDDQLVYVNVSLDDFESIREPLRERINELEGDVVIYDALQSVFGGDQNTGVVGGRVWSWIQQTAKEGGHVPIAIDHSGWQGKHEAGSVQKRGRVGQSIQIRKRTQGVNGDGTEWQIVDVYIRKSNYQVSSEEAPALSIRMTFAASPDLIEGEHDPEDATGPTLFEFVDAPEPEASLLSMIVEAVETMGGSATETEIAETVERTGDAVRKAIRRGQQRKDKDAQRLYVTKTKNPKTWALRE